MQHTPERMSAHVCSVVAAAVAAAAAVAVIVVACGRGDRVGSDMTALTIAGQLLQPS